MTNLSPDATILDDIIVEPDYEYRQRLLDNQRQRMGIGTRREGVHVSDLIFCSRKSWAERQTDYVPEVSDSTVLTWLRGLSHEDLLSEGVIQVQAGFCFTCQRVSGQLGETSCPDCTDVLLTGTIDWIQVLDPETFVPVEMKSTMKSSNKGPQDLAWYFDQIKSYMAIHNLPLGRVAILHVRGDYSFGDPDVRSDGPQADFRVYAIRWRDPSARDNWLARLNIRKHKVLGNPMPALDYDSPAHDMICSYCAIGERLPNGNECEKFPWKRLNDGTYVRKGSKKSAKSLDEMLAELRVIQATVNRDTEEVP
jgi:hypothetical protein